LRFEGKEEDNNAMDYRPYLEEEFRLHPSLENADYVKWAYQVAFGGEHAVEDFAQAEQFFHQEFAETKPLKSVPLFQAISPALLRVNIASFKANGYPEEVLFELFLRSAALVKPNEGLFAEIMDFIPSFIKEKQGEEAAKKFVLFAQDYRQQGLVPIHHSPAYQEAYAPHYRLVLQEEFALFLDRL
jgi:hypothetical protein